MSSNLRNRIRQRLGALTPSSFRDFSTFLQQSPPQHVLTRSIIHEAFFQVGVKLSSVEAQSLWSQFLVYCHQTAPIVALFERFLQIELEKIVVAPPAVPQVKTHLLTHSLSYSLTYSLTLSPNYSLTHSINHLLFHRLYQNH